MLNPNVIIPFDGDNSDIPAGFERDTRFDGKFPKGASSGFGDTAGSDTHTHTATHTHTTATHLHSTTTSGRIDGSTYSMGVSGGRTQQDHGHNGTWRSATMGTETSGSTAATLSAGTLNSCPPFYEVIFIKSLGYNFIPVDGMVFCNGNRSGLTYHSASENRYLRGAAASGNAGATGGSTSHYHTQSHTHTANAHSHTNVLSSTSGNDGEDGMSGPALSPSHEHTLTISNATQNMNSNTTNSSTTSSVEPEFTTLKHYIATNPTLPKPGDIAMTTEDTNPVGWIDCDGEDGTPNLQDTFIKNTQSPGSTGGAKTHTHTLSHSHTGNGTHTHSYSNPTGYSGVSGGHNGSGKDGVTAHRHNITSVSSVTANYNTSAPTSSADNNEPAYIKVKFIQLKYTVAGGMLAAIL